jgi:hemerythrin
MTDPPPEQLRLGIVSLDGEHSFQITLLRALRDAAAGADRKQALELIDQLDDYTNMHFFFEETLMIQRGYPDHEAHRREHNRLIEELRILRQAVTAPGERAPLPEAGTVEQWLLRHIQTFDRALATFIARADRAGG